MDENFLCNWQRPTPRPPNTPSANGRSQHRTTATGGHAYPLCGHAWWPNSKFCGDDGVRGPFPTDSMLSDELCRTEQPLTDTWLARMASGEIKDPDGRLLLAEDFASSPLRATYDRSVVMPSGLQDAGNGLLRAGDDGPTLLVVVGGFCGQNHGVAGMGRMDAPYCCGRRGFSDLVRAIDVEAITGGRGFNRDGSQDYSPTKCPDLAAWFELPAIPGGGRQSIKCVSTSRHDMLICLGGFNYVPLTLEQLRTMRVLPNEKTEPRSFRSVHALEWVGDPPQVGDRGGGFEWHDLEPLPTWQGVEVGVCMFDDGDSMLWVVGGADYSPLGQNSVKRGSTEGYLDWVVGTAAWSLDVQTRGRVALCRRCCLPPPPACSHPFRTYPFGVPLALVAGAKWRQLEPLPGTPRFNHALACVSGTGPKRVYVIGGALAEDDGKKRTYTTVMDNWMYDVAAQTWTRLQDSPIVSGNWPRAVAYRNRYVLLVGGEGYDVSVTNNGPKVPVNKTSQRHPALLADAAVGPPWQQRMLGFFARAAVGHREYVPTTPEAKERSHCTDRRPRRRGRFESFLRRIGVALAGTRTASSSTTRSRASSSGRTRCRSTTMHPEWCCTVTSCSLQEARRARAARWAKRSGGMPTPSSAWS